MKNAIVILVDSIFSDCISRRRTEESSTPFIDSLVSNSLFADSVYSFGPHTDAASKGLYCGNHSLDDYGYYFGMNTSEYNIHRIFKENGYETYAYYYPYYFIGTKTNKYMDNIVFTSGMIWQSIWFGKYGYYSDLIKHRELTRTEYGIVEKFTDFLFDVWRFFYRELNKNNQSGMIISKIKEEGEAGGERILEDEYHKYMLNKREYIFDLLEKGKNHPLAHINEYNPDRYVDIGFLRNIYSKNKSFFRELTKKNFLYNIKNNELHLISGLKEMTRHGAKESTFTRWLMCLLAPLYVKNKSLRPLWQYEPSFFNQITTMFKQLDGRSKSDTPFFFSIHTEDAHQNISYLSYDIQDESVIQDEISYLWPLVKGCGKKYKGNLTYQLSLRYIDLCVKRIFEGLQERHLLSNTSIVLMVDHGSSFSGYPTRDVVVNNFHVENYKTPFMIWNQEPMPYNGFYNMKYSADMILPTICRNFEFSIPRTICQSTIMDNPEGKNVIITEYMGSGVPDMISREVWISARTDEYCIAYKSRIDKPFDINHPFCIYNLKADKLEKNNLVSSDEIKKDAIKTLAVEVKKRFEEIQQETEKLLSNLDDIKVF